jgi:ribosomal protein S18 acetylase RimI-like enzyme
MISIRVMERSEFDRIGEIDRSEEISQDYVCRDGDLHLQDVQWSVPRWSPDGEGEHSVPGKIAAWRPWLEEGGSLFGAFDGEALVAFAIYRPHLSPGMAQFAVLHVSRSYRRQGIGAALAAKVMEAARNDGATQLYVSAAPTRGTVEFYQSLGFRPTREINAELFELEPEDIHMTMSL